MKTTRYKKGQPKPFLLRPEAREISVLDAIPRTEPEAIKWLAKMRWGHLGENLQRCPHCEAVDNHYWVDTKHRWACRAKNCGLHFSVTTQTKFHNTKRSARELASILFHFQEAAEGISSRELSGLHNCTQQSMNVLTNKMREALWETHDRSLLNGEIEVDGAYFFKYKRPGNTGTGVSMLMRAKAKEAGLFGPPEGTDAEPSPTTKSTRAKRTPAKAWEKPDKMHALVAFVQRGDYGEGGVRVRVVLLKDESNQLDLLKMAKLYCAQDGVIFSDEHFGYNLLSGLFAEHRRVRHKTEFKNKEGTHTNMVEGFFAQMRRMQAGAYHRMGMGYIELYATEMAWRYEHRRISNLKRFEDLARRCLTSGRPKQYADYWNKRPLADRIAKPNEGTVAFSIPHGSLKKPRGRPPKKATPVPVARPATGKRVSRDAPRVLPPVTPGTLPPAASAA